MLFRPGRSGIVYGPSRTTYHRGKYWLSLRNTYCGAAKYCRINHQDQRFADEGRIWACRIGSGGWRSRKYLKADGECAGQAKPACLLNAHLRAAAFLELDVIFCLFARARARVLILLIIIDAQRMWILYLIGEYAWLSMHPRLWPWTRTTTGIVILP